jgi:hypothetical protein
MLFGRKGQNFEINTMVCKKKAEITLRVKNAAFLNIKINF